MTAPKLTGMLIAASPCEHCLFGKAPIVSKARKREIVREIDSRDVNFLCHVPQAHGSEDEVVCNASYHRRPGQLARIAQRLNAITFVDMNQYGTADQTETE